VVKSGLLQGKIKTLRPHEAFFWSRARTQGRCYGNGDHGENSLAPSIFRSKCNNRACLTRARYRVSSIKVQYCTEEVVQRRLGELRVTSWAEHCSPPRKAWLIRSFIHPSIHPYVHTRMQHVQSARPPRVTTIMARCGHSWFSCTVPTSESIPAVSHTDSIHVQYRSAAASCLAS
jgi:hypothetical protein